MALLAQKIANLLGGVSQRPATQRLATQLEEQVNALSSLSRGVMKRPPSQHVGKLTSDVTGWDDAFVHVINRDENERYHIVIANGEIKVFDAVNGTTVPVTVADGAEAYLEDSDNRGFRAVTVGDATIITNRGVKVAKTTKKSPKTSNEALAFVRQADFSTLYTITLAGSQVSIRTLDADTPATRQSISTEAVASDLMTALSGISGFTFTQYGAAIHIVKTDGNDFEITSSDGLADQGLRVVKGSVQAFEDLPPRAPVGFVVQVTGSIDTAKDNFFVKYDDLGITGGLGVWRECPEPNTLVELDKTTMPHRLTLRGTFSSRDGIDPVSFGPMQGAPYPRPGTVELVRDPTNVTTQAYDEIIFPYVFEDGPGDGPITQEHHGGVTAVAQTEAPVVQFEFRLDTSVIPINNPVTISLYKNGVLQDSLTFGQGSSARNGEAHRLEARDVAVGDELLAEMTYALNAPLWTQRAWFTWDAEPFFFFAADRVGVVVSLGNIAFVANSQTVFAAGTLMQLTLDGTLFEYTVGTTDETQTQVATALAALVNADADFVLGSSGGGVFRVTRADNAFFTGDIAGIFPLNTFHNHSLSLTPNELVGQTLENVTDGSSGVITANTATTITVAALSGGLTNLFNRGDVCQLPAISEEDAEIGTHFVFEPITWKERGAGSVEVVPFPSFTGFAITEVFFYQNRLGFLSKENVVMSSAGDLFNVFRYTATDLRPDDNIDVRSAHADVTLFDSAFLWNSALYVKSDNAWFRVSGDPVLTPTTVRLDPIGKFPSSKDPRPIVVGERVYFTRAKSGHTQVFEMTLSDDGITAKAADITKELPLFLLGRPLELVGDAAEGFLAVVTSDDRTRIYVRSWLDQDNQRLFESWSYWQLASGTTLVGLGMADGTMGFIRKHSDGAYFELIDLDLNALDPDEEKILYLDRRVQSELGPSGWHVEGAFPSYNEETHETTWTLPYAVPTNQPVGVTNRETGEVYTTTRPTTTTVRVLLENEDEEGIDLTEAPVYIGQVYGYRVKPSTLYIRGRSGEPETGGRLQVRRAVLFYQHSTDFTVTVSPNGRTVIEYVFEEDEQNAGEFKFPVLCRNTEVSIVITNDTPGGTALSEMDWEAQYDNRDRRI